MASRTVPHRVILVIFLASSVSTVAAAQGTNAPRLLDAQATQAFEAGTLAKYEEASALWRRAALRYLDNGWTADAAASFRNAGMALSRAGADSAALEYYGRAVELENPTASHQVRVLLETSPVYGPAGRGVADEARFVGAVNQLLTTVSPDADQVTTADDAHMALENLAKSSMAPITIKCDSGSVDVQFRRSTYARRQPGALWGRATTDTTLHRQPAAYDFRYRIRGTDRDTTVTIPCADGCTLVIH
jgi:tetratricopeptide (TPR) repeat protein